MNLTWAYKLFRSWDNTRLDSACKAFMFINGENVPLNQPYQPRTIVSKHMPVQQIYSMVPPKYIRQTKMSYTREQHEAYMREWRKKNPL